MPLQFEEGIDFDDDDSPTSSRVSSAMKGSRGFGRPKPLELDSPTRKLTAHFADDDSNASSSKLLQIGDSSQIGDNSEALDSTVGSFPSGDSEMLASPSSPYLSRQITSKLFASLGSVDLDNIRKPFQLSSYTHLSAAEKVKAVLYLIVFGLTVWFFMSSVLLILFGVQYDGLVVDQDRMRYVASAAERAAAAAATVLSGGLATRDAVDQAIKSKLYFEPMDYTAVRATLEPVFAGFPALRAVDLAFTDREDYVTLRRLVNDGEAVGSFDSLETAQINVHSNAALAMQSSAADCQMLGERGCLSSAPASAQRWHSLASGLWGGEEADGFWQDSDKVFRWDVQPGFVPRDPSRAGATGSVAWSPAYSLVFRTSFPGSSGKLSVLGRSVIELSDLRAEDSLSDVSLGPRGGIYICDRAGTLLAAATAGQQAFIQQNGGATRFRRIGELETPWASKLKDFDGKKQAFSSEGFYVVVKPLGGRGMNNNFFAVVAAERDMFVDSRLSPMLEAAKIVAVLPYPAFLLIGLSFRFLRIHMRQRDLRRVHVLHEGIATLVNETVEEDILESEEVEDDMEGMNKLRQRIIHQSTAVKRDAGYSMSNFLEESGKLKPSAAVMEESNS